MKFENTCTGNWENAFRGLRHPYESYDRADSKFGICERANEVRDNVVIPSGEYVPYVILGPNDLDLAQRMVRAGTPNDKFMRQIFVSVNITAPEYFWSQLDTYKVGTVANSTSKMHKLSTTPITMDCFETDDFWAAVPNNQFIEAHINFLEELRLKYLETKDMKYWKELIRWLPESWLQTRTWTANYEVLRNIYIWRRNHKLTEWHTFCDWIATLPYAHELIMLGVDDK